MIEHIFDIIKNNVIFTAKGADIEGFLSWCVKNNIEINDPVKRNYRMDAKTSSRNYKKLRNPARRYGIRLKILKKQGIYYFGKRYIRKAGFLFGIIFAVLFCMVMNKFIWVIDVKGNSSISNDEIIISAEKMGLKTGTFAKHHKVQDIEWYILNEIEGLADVQINIQGSIANISVSEREEEPIMKPDDDMPVNIVASTYGIIRKTEVFDGQGKVEPGDAVMKGELLVSAVYEDRHNKLTLKHARANIIAETDYHTVIEFPLEKIIYKKDKIAKKTYKINIFGYDLCIGNDERYKDYYKEVIFKDFNFLGIELPIRLIITRFFDVKAYSITYNFEEAKENAYLLLNKHEENEMDDMEIISRKTNESIKNDKYIIEADYIVLMDIGEEQPVESDIPWENTDDMS